MASASPAPSDASDPSSSVAPPSVAAFDYRDEETKARFLSMLGGGRGGVEKKGRKSGERRAKSPSISAASGPSSEDGLAASSSFTLTPPSADSAAAATPGAGEDGSTPSEAPSQAQAGALRKKKTSISGPRSPKAAERSGVAATAASSAPSTPPTSYKTAKGGGKAAALAALSSRLRSVVSTSSAASAPATPTSVPSSPALSPTQPNGADGSGGGNGAAFPHSLLDPSPSTATSAFSSPDSFQPSSLSQGSAPASSGDAADGGEDEEPPSSISAAAASSSSVTEQEDDDDEDDDGAHAMEHVEPNDAVKGVHRREQLEAMEKDDQLKQTMPWHNSQPSSATTTALQQAAASKEKGSAKTRTPPSLLLRRSVVDAPRSASPSPPAELGSLVASAELTAPSSPLDEGDSPLTVANDYDLPPAAKPLQPPHSSSSSSSSTASSTSASSSSAKGGMRGSIASSSSSSLALPSSASSYVPFTPSPTYFSNPMLPDLSAHGHHIKLILYPIRRQKRKVLLPLQSHACPECGAALRNRMFSRPRYCYYTGLLYCRFVVMDSPFTKRDW